MRNQTERSVCFWNVYWDICFFFWFFWYSFWMLAFICFAWVFVGFLLFFWCFVLNKSLPKSLATGLFDLKTCLLFFKCFLQHILGNSRSGSSEATSLYPFEVCGGRFWAKSKGPTRHRNCTSTAIANRIWKADCLGNLQNSTTNNVGKADQIRRRLLRRVEPRKWHLLPGSSSFGEHGSLSKKQEDLTFWFYSKVLETRVFLLFFLPRFEEVRMRCMISLEYGMV